MPIRLYVGNLPKELEREELAVVFADASDPVSTKVITDRKTGRCRGFGFVTVKDDEQADAIIAQFNGYVLKENPIKIEKALPRSKGKEGGEAEKTGDAQSHSSPSPTFTNSKGGKKKRSKRSHQGTSSYSPTGSDSAQPDPRWANELEKLKEQLLATQSS